MKNNKKGISLIVLVITIIVIIILAAAIILTLNQNNPIQEAKNAVSLNDVSEAKSALSLYLATQQGKSPDYKSPLEVATGVFAKKVVLTEAGNGTVTSEESACLGLKWSDIGLSELNGKTGTYTVADGKLVIE